MPPAWPGARVLAHAGERNLVRAQSALDSDAVHLAGAGPPLWRAQHAHRPARPLDHAAIPCDLLGGADLVERPVEGLGERLMDALGVVARHEARRMPVALEQRAQLVLRDARENRGLAIL
jgi:hypothetical protein